LKLILTHDVDWPRHGPGREHILARKKRFTDDIIRRVMEEGYNPYYGIPDVMEAEERIGVRSTFFFRPWYDDGSSVEEYEDDLKSLRASGWEIGLHVNDASSLESIMREKSLLEDVLGGRVYGSRVHYLRVDDEGLLRIAKAGFLYDSSIMYSKTGCDPRNTGFTVLGGMLVFPITIMDAYLFTYMGLGEEEAASFASECIGRLAISGAEYATLLWHDSSIHMKGGRIYSRILEELYSMDKVELVRMLDAYHEATRSGGK